MAAGELAMHAATPAWPTAGESSMTADIENLVLEHLRAIRADIADLKNRMTGVEVQLSALGQQVAGLTTAVYSGKSRY